MAGTGTHLHVVVKETTGQDFTPGCGCRETVAQMDSKPPSWSLAHMPEIVAKMRSEARSRGWLIRLAAMMPGVKMPLRWMVREAVRRAEEDLARG